MKIKGKDVYLDTLEREDYSKIWTDFEYDFSNPCGECNFGHSTEKTETWFDDMQKKQGDTSIRVGIFLNNRTVIGDVSLQDIDRINRKCTIGMDIAKIENRSKGYGGQAMDIMLAYGFNYLGMERIAASTLDINIGARKALKKCGFTLEGVERKAIYFNGEMHDRYCYGILKEEFNSPQSLAL